MGTERRWSEARPSTDTIAVATFVGGSVCTGLLTNWGRRMRMSGLHALPLLVDALALLAFGLLGASLHLAFDVVILAAVLLLCFSMGLPNAAITKISRAQIRTTHLTDVLTDLGIELARVCYWNRTHTSDALRERADRQKLAIHATLAAACFSGAIAGALAFKHIGFSATVPLALLLALVAMLPLIADLSCMSSG